MTTHKHAKLTAWLTRLLLTAIGDHFDSLLDEAARKKLSRTQAVSFLCKREISARSSVLFPSPALSSKRQKPLFVEWSRLNAGPRFSLALTGGMMAGMQCH